jgi:hypothetical protein
VARIDDYLAAGSLALEAGQAHCSGEGCGVPEHLPTHVRELADEILVGRDDCFYLQRGTRRLVLYSRKEGGGTCSHFELVRENLCVVRRPGG